MISAVFIDRPRLAVVISIVITIAGALALLRIPVAQFPDIVPPQVAGHGAPIPAPRPRWSRRPSAQPIEAQVIGVDKMLYMKSTSGNDGSYTLTVSFAVGTDPDHQHRQRQQPRAAGAAQLPQEVQRQGVTIKKKSSAMLQVIALQLDRRRAGPAVPQQLRHHQPARRAEARAGRRRRADLFGALDYSMRIWFDIDRLTSLEPHAHRHRRGDPGAERPGRGRPHRRAADRRRPSSSSSTSRPRAG